MHQYANNNDKNKWPPPGPDDVTGKNYCCKKIQSAMHFKYEIK